MANERTYPCLPCAELDPAIAFYEALGFAKTYRQLKPNPYAVVKREDLQVHLFGITGFDPQRSYGNAIVAVPDPDTLYQHFAAGLRKAYGKLPVQGIPRITRPRKKYGTVYGFSVVDLGGNWLRISGAAAKGLAEDEAQREEATGLAAVIAAAARLGDAHGDDAKALRTLDSGLKRFVDAPAAQRARALLYGAELALRIGDAQRARHSYALALALPLSEAERTSLSDELAHVAEWLEP